MCGIFGFIASEGSGFDSNLVKQTVTKLALLSESRGKESSGFAFYNYPSKSVEVLKGPIPVSRMLERLEFRDQFNFLLKSSSDNNILKDPLAVMGHSRLVTNGSLLDDNNNQPVVKNGMVCIHNGIIVNHDDLWNKFNALKKEYEVDTEIMLALIEHFRGCGYDLVNAVKLSLNEISGTVATAIMFSDCNKMILTTNNGSLYTLNNHKTLMFASEQFILNKIAENRLIRRSLREYEICQVVPGSIIELDINDFTINYYLKNNNTKIEPLLKSPALNNDKPFIISQNSVKPDRNLRETVIEPYQNNDPKSAYLKKILEYNSDAVKNLKRCKKCLLPETFPFIVYDEEGVCNVCRNHKKKVVMGVDSFLEGIKKYRNEKGTIDCIIPFSGGRDSSYSVHFLKNVLGLNPITYTYDWGMVTDLARRNIARVCSKLEIENIIVSADITKKRENIRKNILAWLKKPNLGLVPLFMAGDKQFHYYLAKLKKQNNIKLSIWGTNFLENTDFKLGFCGITFDYDKKRISSLKTKNKIKLAGFYLLNYLSNPAYLNTSIFDTLKSFVARYFNKKGDYFFLYDFIQWDEKLIDSTLINEYGWETSKDTTTNWRIGDGTASFYNYIYFTVAGFSEYDTFRSNQIREGMITREEGLELIYKENRPRYDSLKWYLDIVGLDFETTIKTINNISKLYKL